MKSQMCMRNRLGLVYSLFAALGLSLLCAGPLSATNVGGRISTNTTWTLAGSPYIVTSSVSVGGTSTQTATLTIEAGVQVKFNGNYYIQIGLVNIKGALYAVGTLGNPIVFTSNMSTPARGNWDCIKFDGATDDAMTQMAYCRVEYGGSNSSNGSIRSEGSSPTINNCTIRYSKYCGMYCASGGSPVIQGGSIMDNNTQGIYSSWGSITINETSFSGNGSYAISLGISDEIFSTSGITGAASDRVERRSGTLNLDRTWRNLGIPYCVTGNISIYKDTTTAAKLTIEAGVQVKFNGNYSINIGSGSNKGALYAVGTSGSPIVFTSNKKTPARGDWNCIYFTNPTDDVLTEMAYCTLEYGGSSSFYGEIRIEASSPKITNCTIRNSKYCGIMCSGASPIIEGGSIIDNNTQGINNSGGSVVTINATSFSGNGSYAISMNTSDEIITTSGIFGAAGDRVEIKYGTINKNITWRNLEIPYCITGSITVCKDTFTAATLTIEPGAHIMFNGYYKLSIGQNSNKGALHAVGTGDNPIVFTSNLTTPQPGDWDGIYFLQPTVDDLTEMKYCIVEYGGSSSSEVSVGNSTPMISHCKIRYSKNIGISIGTSSPTIMFCSIYNNVIGIRLTMSESQVNHCNIYGNTQYGINNVTSTKIVDARYNWWGHASGPSGVGPGSGDAVTNYVAFEPWLGLLYSYPYCIAEGLSTTKQLTTNGGTTWLFGRAEEDSNWAIVIKNSSQQTVKTYGQSGKKIRKSWDGKDSGGTALPAGAYTYQIQAQRQSDLSEATPLVGIIAISTDYPVGFMSAPLPGDYIAGNISVVGSASDPDFKNYKLEYGNAICPSAWVVIRQSTTSVTNGELGSVNFSELENPYVTLRLTVTDNSSHSTVSSFSCVLSAYEIKVNPNPFSPNGDGKKETTTISAQFFAVSDWTLAIKDPTGLNVIRSFSGSGSSFSQQWDGKNESGVVQGHGIYPYVLTVSNPSMEDPDTPGGNISLDVTPPTAQITDPTEEELFSNIFGGSYTAEIDGTASDENFLNFKLEYGETYSPSSWTLIGQYTSSVTNAKLGELNTSAMAAGQYTIRLTVLDKADNDTTALVHFRIGHLRLSLSAHELNVGASGTVTVTTEVPVNATETVFIKDKAGATRRTLVNGLVRTSGVYNDIWDGKDDSGTNLPQAEYFVLVTVVTPDPVTYTLDQTNTGGVRRPEGQDPRTSIFHLSYPSDFSPYEGEEAGFTFDLDEPSLVDLFVKVNQLTGKERNLLIKEPLSSGSHSILWDGTGDDGGILSADLSGYDNLVVFWAYSLSDNGIVVYGDRPEATSLSVNPAYFSPVDHNYPDGLEIAYSLSKASTVDILFQNGSGAVVRTMNLGSQSAGSHTVHWDGRTGNGELCDRGSYRIGIKLTDSLGNVSLIRYCLIDLFY